MCTKLLYFLQYFSVNGCQRIFGFYRVHIISLHSFNVTPVENTIFTGYTSILRLLPLMNNLISFCFLVRPRILSLCFEYTHSANHPIADNGEAEIVANKTSKFGILEVVQVSSYKKNTNFIHHMVGIVIKL